MWLFSFHDSTSSSYWNFDLRINLSIYFGHEMEINIFQTLCRLNRFWVKKKFIYSLYWKVETQFSKKETFQSRIFFFHTRYLEIRLYDPILVISWISKRVLTVKNEEKKSKKVFKIQKAHNLGEKFATFGIVFYP